MGEFDQVRPRRAPLYVDGADIKNRTELRGGRPSRDGTTTKSGAAGKASQHHVTSAPEEPRTVTVSRDAWEALLERVARLEARVAEKGQQGASQAERARRSRARKKAERAKEAA